MKCLAKRPADRWQTADELLAQLEPLATPSGGTTPAQTRPVAAARRPVVSTRAAIVFAVVGLAGAAVAILLASHRSAEVTLGRRTQVTLDPGLEVDPAISPDGKFIAYAAGPTSAMKLFVRQLEGGNIIPLSRDLSGNLRRPLWSPYSVFTETANVWSLPLPQGDAISITGCRGNHGQADHRGHSHFPRRPVAGVRLGSEREPGYSRMPVAGGEPEQLTTDPQDDFSPAWSPDGKEIAFHSFRNGNRDTFVIPAAGGPAEPVVATPAQERAADWSTDGQQLAFSSNQTGRYELYIVSREGRKWGTPRRLTRDMNLRGRGRFRWSPDGRFIAYLEEQSLEIIAPAGGEPRKLVDVQDSIAQPVPENLAWSPDSRLVYYVAHDARGQAGLWSVALTGGAPRLLVRFDDPATDFGRGISR